MLCGFLEKKCQFFGFKMQIGSFCDPVCIKHLAKLLHLFL